MDRVLLIDTYSVFFRAFFALPSMTTRAGQPTSAVYGLCVLLLKLLREEQPKGFAFARDAPARTFRHEQYADYKAQRPPVATPLQQQFPLLDRVLEAFGAPVFSAAGFEADDVLATLARELGTQGERVLLVSGDRDLFQTIAEQVEVLFIGRRGQKPIVYDLAAIAERYGLLPRQLPSLIALTGDSSDNLPGVAGIGARTAQKLIAQYGSIEALLARLDSVSPASARDALRAAAASMQRTETLARLRDDVPLGGGARFAPLRPAARDALRALFEELEFRSLVPRLDKLTVG